MFKNNIKFKLENNIQGAKGRSQPEGGGTAALKPPDGSANLFQSISYLSVLDLIGEGPIDGFSNSIDGTRCIGSDILSSIFYDSIPLKQPTERKYAVQPITIGSFKEMGVVAQGIDDPNLTTFYKAISGEIDELIALVPSLSLDGGKTKYPLQLGLTYLRSTPPTIDNYYSWEVSLLNGGSGYKENFNADIGFVDLLDPNDNKRQDSENLFFNVGSNGIVNGIGSVGITTETILLPGDEEGLPGRWSVISESIPAPEEIEYSRQTLQIESRIRALQAVQATIPTGNKSPFGYIQYRLNKSNGGVFDFGANGSESGIKMYPSTKVYLSNTWDNNGNLYERYFRDDFDRNFEINADFIEGAFQFDEANPITDDIAQGKVANVFNVTGMYGYGYLLFRIGGPYIVNGFFNSSLFYANTSDGTIDSKRNNARINGYDFFTYDYNSLGFAAPLVLDVASSEQIAPLKELNEGETLNACFFVENFRNLNFNNASIDYRLGEEGQTTVPIYASGSRDYQVNFQLYGYFTGTEDIRQTGGGGTQNYSSWSLSELPKDYDEFAYTHIVQQREVELAVPTLNIQKLFDTQHTGSQDLGKKLKNTLNIRVEYGFEGDDIPLGFSEIDGSLNNSDNDDLVSAAAAQGISPESLILQSYKQVKDYTFEGIVDYPYYTQLTGLGALPVNTTLEDKTFGNYFNNTQLNTFGLQSSDPAFPGGKWKDINRYVKVRKMNEESESILIGRECAVASMTEFLNSSFSYPFSAFVGNTVDARSFSQAPQRTYQARMKKVLIPTNYYPLRADGSDKRFRSSEFGAGEEGEYVYYGEWDGTFRLAWTDNPAWIIYDLITNTRYGVGNQIDEIEDVDIFELYTIGRYCDAVDADGKFVGLPDGNGGLEPRFSCNLAIDQTQNAFQLIGNVASIFRGMVYWNAGTLNFSIDQPKPISAVFNNENVFDGMFSYGDISSQERFTRVSVSYMDKRDEYKTKKEYVDDEEGIRNYGIIVKEMNALGCTSRSQARRLANYILLSNKLETETVQFQTDARAITLSPGDIIRIDDELKHFEINYGKVLDKSVLNGYIEIDNQINTGNIALNADSALYLYNDSMDQNDLRTLYDISKFNDNLVKTGESLTLAAINNQDTNNLIAKLGEQYTGFDKWTNDFDSIAQFGTAGLNTLFGYRYFGIQDSSNSSRSASLIGFNKRIENGETYCLSTFVNTGAIEPSEEWVFRIWFQKFDQSDPPISQLTGQIGMRIKNGSLSQWANPPNWANNFEIISSGIHEEIGMPNMRWSRPYISVKTKTNGVTLSGIELFTNPSSLQDTVEFALPQLELGEIPTPFNSNDFHANNFINKFTITGVGPNGSSNGYRLFLDKDTVEYSTFNEVPIGSYFNLQLDNGLEELYKVIKISPQENNLYSVEGLQYYSGKFEQIENETYVEDQINVNVGLPLNTVTRPAPTNFIDYDVTAQLDEYGRYYIQASIVLLGLTSAERFRVSLQYPNGKYAYKETDIGENGNASVYFLNLPTAGTYTVLITSIKNPEAKIADKVTIQIPNN